MSIALDQRRSAYATILGVAAIVVAYAVLHDQYVVRIAPEHFTVYHDPLWSIRDPSLLAAAYGFLASLAPGLILGQACLIVGRFGKRPKIPVRAILIGVVVVVIATEIVALIAGGIVWLTGRPFLPGFLFPDPSVPLLVTQTIQLATYAASALSSAALLLRLHRRRNKPENHRGPPDTGRKNAPPPS
jgi:hypothetical protein